MAVAVPEPALLLYPVYYVVVNGALALVIRHRRGAFAPHGRAVGTLT